MTAHEAETGAMTCKDVIGLLAEYLESELGQDRVRELEEHLAGCEACQAYFNTYQRTRTLTAESERVAMPDEMKHRLRQFLLRTLANDR